jgi:hypothetical protein
MYWDFGSIAILMYPPYGKITGGVVPPAIGFLLQTDLTNFQITDLTFLALAGGP